MTAPALHPPRPAPRRRPTGAAPSGPQLRVVAGRHAADDRDQRRLVRQLAGVATAVVALCIFGVVVFHVVLTQNQFRLDALHEQAEQRQVEYDRLRLQVAQLESPDRVVADAQQRLGMITPPKVTYLTPSVDEPGATVSPAPATPAAPAAETGWSTVKPHLAGR